MSSAHDLILAKADFGVPPALTGFVSDPPEPVAEPDELLAVM